MKRLSIILIMVAISVAIQARFELPKPNLNPFADSGINTLFNPSRLKMSHSMGFQAGASSSGGGYYLSRYTNHIQYIFNPRLTLDLDLNFVNFGSASTTNSLQFNDDNKTKILPRFSLNFKPTDSMTFQIRFQQHLNPYHPAAFSITPW